jgi:thiamine kinase-like enzyme
VTVATQHAEALETIARRFGLDGREVEPLTGGSRNHVYRLGRPPLAVAVRLAGAGDEQLGVCREAELIAQRAAAANGLAPRVLWSDPPAGLKVDEWVVGRAWSREEARRPESIKRVARWLRSLHDLPPPTGLRAVDFCESLRRYCALLPSAQVPASLLAEAEGLRVQPGAMTTALCHHDLHHANILDTGETVVAVDWEYAGLGDPIMDLAGFAAYQQLDEAGERTLLAAYGEEAGVEPHRLDVARRLFEAVAQAWSGVLATVGG